ncbi:MarR family winged helix-turn-helix transcriptional regulator [Yoonia sediminilitoris]|uniref:DNA-binding MarR family transcriptional regulator n=1 Tax=Yoonia sediminilitoris TaxID=1286148 RepID=A0A2T6KAJ9_9RHOB|nr:MarR family transcriptional regulator [Yoonia sediminilitoris]PUB11818.1 DNA-binding MarR family transcriptional regulator [Yoonia sediminilitoris]RCW91895.1 DNA-binding MarR family transcriptional regulator [Yoonia sediminilitoris]
MSEDAPIDAKRLQKRRAQEDSNIFVRLPAAYAASRVQGRRFLQHGGDLSIVEWRTLWDLHEAGPMTIRDLANIQRTDHSLLSRALPQMRDKGYVTMTRGLEDARQIIVTLTEKGADAYAKAAPIMARRRAALREEFTDAEIAVFIGFLDRLDDFLRRPVEDLLQMETVK